MCILRSLWFHVIALLVEWKRNSLSSPEARVVSDESGGCESQVEYHQAMQSYLKGQKYQSTTNATVHKVQIDLITAVAEAKVR